MRVLNPENFVDQMRLNTGDYIEEEDYLSDAIYVWYYTQTGNSVLDGSILALESIINNIALSPERWAIGDSSETRASVPVLTQRLNDLRTRKNNLIVPIVIKSDRKNWKDFDKAFGCN